MKAPITVWRPRQAIRPVAIGVLRDGDRMLVAEVPNDDGSVKGWRPLGGGVEFGETAEAALRREFQEELGVEIEVAGPPTIFENLYDHAGHVGHEIIFAFPIRVAHPFVRAERRFRIQENDGTIWVEWIETGRFEAGEVLFPTALGPLLDKI
jgi:8-oxo-dGTP pyrophosphatase MutT (NUDIX family)